MGGLRSSLGIWLLWGIIPWNRNVNIWMKIIIFNFKELGTFLWYSEICKNVNYLQMFRFNKILKMVTHHGAYTVQQTSIYHISRWCRHPVSRLVTAVSWRQPPWITGNSTRQSAWRRTWRDYWFSGDGHRVCKCQSDQFMTYCLPSPYLCMVARYSLPHMLKSLHRLAIAIIVDSTNEEWMTKKLMLI